MWLVEPVGGSGVGGDTCRRPPTSIAEFKVNLALGVGPVVAAGDAGSAGDCLHQGGGVADSFGLSGSGLLNVASLVRPPKSSFC